MIDLHIHSNYSDGTCTIEEILAKAKSLNLSQISITDHNTLEGSIAANKIADIDFIIGSELSVDYKGNELHLLSFFPNGSDYKNVQFIINESEAYKKIAILEMIENLNKMGYEIQINELKEFTKGVMNRVHICKALMKHGYINSVSEGFEKLIGDHCEAYVERKVISIKEACAAVHKDGGIAIIAHPYEYTEFVNVDELIEDIHPLIDGIECFHPSASSNDSMHLLELANKYNLKVTGGSDFHGNNKPNINLNMMQVDDKYKIKK